MGIFSLHIVRLRDYETRDYGTTGHSLSKSRSLGVSKSQHGHLILKSYLS